jgi:DNA-binding CsgD family transcriptional regulator
LREAYGLTAAEARLAACLARRPGLVAAAKELGIAHETARQHLKRILLKTGCSGQPELVAMLAADLPLLIGRGADEVA